MPTSYANPGGTGDRTSIILATNSPGVFHNGGGSAVNLIDGLGTVCFFRFGGEVAGQYIRFDFGEDQFKLINEALLYQDVAQQQGFWQWQASLDESTWTNIGNPFRLGQEGSGATPTPQVHTELHSNVYGYRYYQLLGISEHSGFIAVFLDLEFKIDDGTPPPSILGYTGSTPGIATVS